MVKNLSANAGDTSSVGQEGSPEKEVTVRSGILAWEIPWTEQQGGLQSRGSHRIRHNLATNNKSDKTTWPLLRSPGVASDHSVFTHTLLSWYHLLTSLQPFQRPPVDDGGCGLRLTPPPYPVP